MQALHVLLVKLADRETGVTAVAGMTARHANSLLNGARTYLRFQPFTSSLLAKLSSRCDRTRHPAFQEKFVFACSLRIHICQACSALHRGLTLHEHMQSARRQRHSYCSAI